MSRSNFYERVGYVVLYDAAGRPHKFGVDKGEKAESNLDFKFSITKMAGSEKMPVAHVSVLGVSKDFINRVLYWGPRDERLRKRIEVYAGYADVGAELLFKGYVYNASVSAMPEMWLSMDADNYDMVPEVWNGTILKTSLQTIALTCAHKFGKTLDWDSSLPNLKVEKFVANGLQLSDALNRIADCDPTGRLFLFAEGNVIRAVDKTNQDSKLELSLESGLMQVDRVGYQTKEGLGIEITARLDSIWRPGANINLKSVLNPTVDGLWHINQVTYTGQLRGADWKVRILGFRPIENNDKK